MSPPKESMGHARERGEHEQGASHHTRQLWIPQGKSQKHFYKKWVKNSQNSQIKHLYPRSQTQVSPTLCNYLLPSVLLKDLQGRYQRVYINWQMMTTSQSRQNWISEVSSDLISNWYVLEVRLQSILEYFPDERVYIRYLVLHIIIFIIVNIINYHRHHTPLQSH